MLILITCVHCYVYYVRTVCVCMNCTLRGLSAIRIRVRWTVRGLSAIRKVDCTWTVRGFVMILFLNQRSKQRLMIAHKFEVMFL